MKKNLLQAYQSVIDQCLSNRAMARLLKLPVKTAHDRLRKFKATGSLAHGNTGNNHRKPNPNKPKILSAAAKYDGFGISHICELLESRHGLRVNRETLRRGLARPKSLKVPKQKQRRECSSIRLPKPK
jgi:transposase